MTVTIYMGLPGSGKSTAAKEELGIVVCQDVFGSRGKCIEVTRNALKEGKSVVIDRTNVTKIQRKHWLDLANEFGAIAHCVFLNTPKDICIERVKTRIGHPTFDNLSDEKKIEIVEKFQAELELPEMNEGFRSIETRYGN